MIFIVTFRIYLNIMTFKIKKEYMAKTIYQGFDDFHDDLKYSKTEDEATRSHRESIRQCLENNFNLKRFVKIGSFGNGTNISGYSDTDYLAEIPTIHLKQYSNYSLTKVKNVLEARFPNTNVKIDNPAIVCPFGTFKSETTEVVIADLLYEKFSYNGYNYPVYDISDGSDGWMKICPDVHNDYVRAIDNNNQEIKHHKVKPLIRFIKAWKYYNNVPISSFYLEMFVAKYCEKEEYIDYKQDIYRILNSLTNNELSDINDPTGFSTRIKACKTSNFKNDALSKLNTASIRAKKAQDYALNNDIVEAFEWFNKLYNNKFPKY